MDKSERRLKQYQDAIDASNIVSKTDIFGYITFVNDEFCNISKYSKSELIGANHNIVRHPDVNSNVFRELWNTILSKKVYKGIIKNLAKDGSVFYLNATIIPILDEKNEIEEFVAIRHNVTEVVELNERLLATKNELKDLNSSLEEKVKIQTKKLIELNQNLEKKVSIEVAKNEEKNSILLQQSRLASMGEMIANIAHQWRQPLSELSIDLFKMKQNINNVEKFLYTYEHAKVVIKNMSNTIDDFRNFFKTDKEKEKFFISESVNAAITMLKGIFAKSDIKIECDFKEDVEILGFKSELSQVFMNLLGNAKDAMKDLDDKRVEIGIKMYKNFVVVYVFNTGKNIEKEILKKIFEPYFTTKHQSVGTGLGLYIGKMIVENMGGLIDVENVKNGVKFNIKIPISKGG
ncbi:PAS domain S-box protein [Campylobacter sp. FMV-PI01]|uniref:histidine kinase n=1 Tax=Campylobacter portucalensis TaxID=2608384 RepID=A0A6L5WJW2_9BACT|nr:HAMP domain-containing sensor histidine kinase [Campylobacter portucalensis]MSN96143.1 PAS domain S-box protein [Campylobacter portucalensis]